MNLSSSSCTHSLTHSLTLSLTHSHSLTLSPLPHIRDVRLCLWRKLRSNSCSVRPGDAPAIIRAVASYKNTRGSADWKCQLQEACSAWVTASRPLHSTKQPIPVTFETVQWPLRYSTKEQGSYNLVQNTGHKGPVLNPKSIGPGRARTHTLFYSMLLHKPLFFNVNKKVQLDATVCRHLFIAASLYMFRVSQHPSSGVLKTVSATSGISHGTGTATSFHMIQLILDHDARNHEFKIH